MKLRNKPGGLAVVIDALSPDARTRQFNESKIGLVVRTVKIVPKGFILKPAWCCSGTMVCGSTGTTWLVVHEPTGNKWLHGDARLLPINPDELEDEEQTEKEIENQ